MILIDFLSLETNLQMKLLYYIKFFRKLDLKVLKMTFLGIFVLSSKMRRNKAVSLMDLFERTIC